VHRWLCLATLWIAACTPEPATRLQVALQLEVDPTGERDWGAGLEAGLRATRLSLAVPGSACGEPDVSHELRVGRQYTATSVITGVVLRDCRDDTREVQNFVQPRHVDRNPDRAVVAWMEQRLSPPAPPP
jgi:hypothetical protein